MTRTFADLRRRRVFRVGAAYGVAAWLIVEVSSVVLPALRMPEWTLTAVVIVALAGIPISLLLAWLYDLTSQGLVRTAPAGDDHQEVQRVARRGIDFVIIGVLLAIIAYLVYRQDLLGLGGQAEQSIAVLPFVDLSQAGDNEYFSDGISEELLNSLVSVEGLRVAARTSSFAFKKRNEDIRTIGEMLNVRTVLEGSVRRSGDQVRITAQLINVDDGFHLWSESYDRELDDIFSIQAEIAHSIVEALKLELIGDDGLARMAAPSVDVRAYDLYLLGRHRWHERTPESLDAALELFQQAVEIDENFALAYSGLADTYLLLDLYGNLTTAEASMKAELPVARALALDDGLAEAYASLGLLRFNQGDLTAAELALRKAITLNGNYSMAHMWLGLVLDKVAGPADALQEYRRAQAIDPLHPVINSNLANTLGATGHYDEARVRLVSLSEADPDSDMALFNLSQLHADYGRLDDAARVALDGLATGDNALGHLALARSLMALGEFERADSHLEAARGNLPHKTDTIGARALLLGAQGRHEELVAMFADVPAELSREEFEAEPKRAMALVWSGYSALLERRFETAVRRLKRGVDLLGQSHASAGDVLPIYTGLGLAQEAIGQTAAAEVTIREGIELGEAALADGWNHPQIHAWLALLLHMDGQGQAAMRRLRVAVDAGWRDYLLVAWHPEMVEWMEEAEFAELVMLIRSDLDRMRANVEPLIAGEENRLAVSQ